MIDAGRTFVVASDEALVGLIFRARKRLVVVAPALSKPVAEAVCQRFHDLGDLFATVILDSDPEVYRLGFGEQDALELVRTASAAAQFDLREQPGVRIGVIISDDTTMVFAPVSKNIEAGSTEVERPNAIVLSGGATERLAAAAGAGSSEDAPPPEVGMTALEPTKVQQMLVDLKANPPKPFDITRKLNVFSSKVQYVEFSASNYRLTTREIRLPPELVDVADDDLKTRIRSRIRAPFEEIGKLDITVEYDGQTETIKIDDDWLRSEKKRIEDEYTFQINKFGRVILYTDRDAFTKAKERFERIIRKYQQVLRLAVAESKETFQQRIVNEFAPRWTQHPPKHFVRWGTPATAQNIEAELKRLAEGLFEEAVSFQEPEVKALYKNVAPENLRDADFVKRLRAVMEQRRVPAAIIASLFEAGQAAPETGAFLPR